MKLRYYNNLDGVRGIAALMVVVFHFFTYQNSSYIKELDIYQQITEFGQHGVSLFFVLSGFVITRILINTRQDVGYFRTFYKRRVLRILPLYYLFLIVYYTFLPYLTHPIYTGLKYHLPFYLYYQNFAEVFNFASSGPGHYWSLAVEEHFYLLWPLIIYFINPKNLWKVIGISVILVSLLKFFLLLSGISINIFTFTRIDQLFIGAYLSVLEKKGFFNKRNSIHKMIVVGLFTLVLASIVYFLNEKFFLVKEITKYLLLGLLFFSLLGVLISLRETHFLNRILSGSILQYLGRISYGIYVWHVLALLILNRFLIFQIALMDLALTIILTIFIAHFSYFYFEKLFLRFKDKKISLQNMNSIVSIRNK